MSRIYNVVYLAPLRLLKDIELLRLQREHSKTFIEEIVIPALCHNNRLEEFKHEIQEFERIFTGLHNNLKPPGDDIIGRVATIWYAFTRRSHASLGPRIGNFTEQLIEYWIKKTGVNVYLNVNVTKYFAGKFDLSIKIGKQKIDYIIEDPNNATLSLIELRESEHTGGRTGQESLMDKLTDVLKWIEEKELRNKLLDKGYKKLELTIAILFSEKDRALLSDKNYSEGRFTSLRDYMLRDKHIGGALKKLINEHNYMVSIDGCKNYTSISYNRKLFDSVLKETRRICLKKDDFTVIVSILWGNEFFKRFTGKSFEELMYDKEIEVADDIWLFFSVAINEFKIHYEFNKTNLVKIYNYIIEKKWIRDAFTKLYNNTKINNITEYFYELNKLISKIVSSFSEEVEGELRLLETNDYAKQRTYLKQLCLVALSMYHSGICEYFKRASSKVIEIKKIKKILKKIYKDKIKTIKTRNFTYQIIFNDGKIIMVPYKNKNITWLRIINEVADTLGENRECVRNKVLKSLDA